MTIPPVTTLPAYGSLLLIFSIYGATRSSNVVRVAETNQLSSGRLSQNFSGRPNSSPWAAIFFHRDQLPPKSLLIGAGVLLSPYVVLSVILPFVTNTNSFSVSSIFFFTPSFRNTNVCATFLSPTLSTKTFSTTVLYWKSTS